MKISFNQLDRGYKKFKTEYDNAAISVLESGMYILGKQVEMFENKFANYIGSSYCVGLNSGLDALILAFRSLGIGPGDEVIVPANTFIASMIGITENGAIPVFIDPDKYFNLDANLIERSITKKTKAILVVHLYGQAANMKQIKIIADKHNLFLVEDCAQSHGASHDSIMTGRWGIIGCFSFYPTKNIGAFGDSGAIVTDDFKIYEKIKMLRNYGSKHKYQNEIIGVNSRLDEIQAALLIVKLEHYTELKLERHNIANKYLKGIINQYVKLPEIREKSDHVWHLFVLQCTNREEFQQHLKSRNIDTQIHYPIPAHLSKAYDFLGHKKGDFPITEEFSSKIISLPLYEGMTDFEIQYVIESVNSFKSVKDE